LRALMCETCGEEIRDDEEMVVWQDAYTHQRCTPDDSEAQGEKEDALDLIRWAESRHAALEPVAGNIMPPGTYACYAGDGDDPYMGPGILGAIRAARRGEALGDGPVGAVCANCGAPNAAIAGGELDPDEAVCSVECYEQLMELGCPQEHGGTYRPKPARRGEGGGE